MKNLYNRAHIPNKSQNKMTQIPTSFESLEIRIWILPFGLAQGGGESFDFAQDREPVERLVEPFVIYYLVLGILSIMVATVLRYPFLFFYKAKAIQH
jgi:hypothetical protein